MEAKNVQVKKRERGRKDAGGEAVGVSDDKGREGQ